MAVFCALAALCDLLGEVHRLTVHIYASKMHRLSQCLAWCHMHMTAALMACAIVECLIFALHLLHSSHLCRFHWSVPAVEGSGGGHMALGGIHTTCHG